MTNNIFLWAKITLDIDIDKSLIGDNEDYTDIEEKYDMFLDNLRIFINSNKPSKWDIKIDSGS